MLINFSQLITFNVYGKRKQATFFPSKIQENEIIFFSFGTKDYDFLQVHKAE